VLFCDKALVQWTICLYWALFVDGGAEIRLKNDCPGTTGPLYIHGNRLNLKPGVLSRLFS
jgi:hypothetical protein